MLRQYYAMCSGESSSRFAGLSLSCALEVLLWQRLLCLHVYSDLFTLITVPCCRKIVKDTVDKFGRIDVLVNNASFQGKDVEKFEDITRERLEFTFHSNILAYFSVAQAAVPHFPRVVPSST